MYLRQQQIQSWIVRKNIGVHVGQEGDGIIDPVIVEIAPNDEEIAFVRARNLLQSPLRIGPPVLPVLQPGAHFGGSKKGLTGIQAPLEGNLDLLRGLCQVMIC